MPVHASACWRMSRGAAVALLAFSLAACSLTLIAPYDPITDELLTLLHRRMVGVLDLLPGMEHEVAAPAFVAVRGDLRTLKARNQARPLNDLTLGQIDAMTASWDRLETLCKLGPMSRMEVEFMRRALDVELRAAMGAEMDKRRLK